MIKNITKLSILIVLIFGLFYSVTQASIYVPGFNLIINQHTVGDDGNFTFKVAGSYINDSGPNPDLTKTLNIQTVNGIGTNTDFYEYFGLYQTNRFYLIQDSKMGWNTPSIECHSDNPLVTISPIENGVFIIAQDLSSIVCDFSNTKKGNKTPVLFIPGVLGTEMFDESGKQLWIDVNHTIDVGDIFLNPLKFNKDFSPFDIHISTGEVIKKVTVNLFLDKISVFDYIDKLINDLKSQNYTQGVNSNDNLFTFPYDWRYGVTGILGVMGGKNITTVDLLKDKINEIRLQTGSDKVDIIAHSTGGLLLKKYVMDNQTDNHIGKAIFVGVPNTGAPQALKTLFTGSSFGNPFLNPIEMRIISQNMPIIYDLSPSQEYYNKKGSYLKVVYKDAFSTVDAIKNLDFNQTNDLLVTSHNVNAQALTNAHNLHTADFDNFDLRTAGIDLYAIDGCKAGTITKIIENRSIYNGKIIGYGQPELSLGDNTVPLESATNLPINQNNKYYALKADHGRMPSQEGIRQQIVNILSGGNLAVDPKLITQDISKCELNGKAISIYSPLDIDITDQDGNHSGLINGAIQNDIPNASFEIMDDHKFVYLPTDDSQTYAINLKGTGNGTFTLDSESIVNSKVADKEVFSNIPVTTSLVGKVNLEGTTTLSLDNDGNGTVDANLSPSSTIDANQAQDLISPITTANTIGTVGQPNFYRTDVSVNLSSTDPVIVGQENQTSGILKTVYKLDNDSSYTTYTNPISISSEGSHTIRFFSTDKAGNNEQEQSLTFTIDKTAPEFAIQFNPSIQDLQFIGSDNISQGNDLALSDQGDTVTLKDQAGNTTEMKLKNKDRKHLLKAEIKSLSYNGKSVDISKNELSFVWLFDKSKKPLALSQHIRNKKDFSVYAEYLLNKTLLIGKDQNGKINKTINGLTILKISTVKGDLAWSY